MDYKVILEAIKGKNVELRHDVDLSLVSAYNMALLENEMGVNSIYYIRFDCDYYNAFSADNQSRMKLMKKMGHEIGLHVDSKHVDNKKDLTNYLSHYTIYLDYSKFTFHINTNITKKLIEKEYYGKENKSIVDKYISDSRGEFDQTKLDWIKENDNFTLLIHPEWWMHEGTKEEIIAKAIKEILP
jgi:outer membrane receptor for Fe3+-dicitrate